jgi:flagellar biosynthesis/type III secretory pathway protein FliH
VVREGLERVRRASRVRVRVHPSDAAQLIELEAEVVEDPSITRGGCVVESELGEVDARLEVRLDALARAIGAR